MSSEQKIVIIDGGLSTELKDLGYDLSDSKLWTSKALIKDPDVLKQAHINFLNSGAQIIETASYQLNVSNIIKETGCTMEEAKEYIRKSVKIALEAKEEANLKNACIAGSIGPYGACLANGSEYDGSYVNDLTLDFLIEWHRPRLECLIEAGCDLIAFETIPSIKEAAALIELLSQFPETKAWLSFCCKDETSLCNGDLFKDAYDKFKENKQLVAIGVNCTNPSYVSNLLKSVTKQELPFIVYSNDGSEWDSANFKFVSAYENPIQIVYDMLPEWIRLGARYVGGCCNIGSKYLRAFPNIVQNMNNSTN